ncbi:hypothetical protein [Citrobacter freundii]|uniref:hypothetical protein n=1 Tax=Citrobacter freundii TaxID=546 RepID=UPI0015EBA5E0|nr:hypothetical protein [Citrobacter freundii]
MVTVNNTPIHLSDLNDAFLAVDSAKLECDVHTLMLSHALMEAKIPHLRFLGKVTVKGCDFVLSPHLWLQIDGFTVDYRLRMWINLFCGPDKASGAPHGIFSSLHYPKHHYEPLRPAPCNLLAPNLLDLITDGFASKICIPESTLAWYSTGQMK